MKSTRLMTLVALVCLLLTASLPGLSYSTELHNVGDNIVQEGENGRMWTTTKTDNFSSLAEVNDFLNQLNQGRYSDWRLPTKWELLKFYNYFDLKKAGDVKLQIEGNYWVIGEDGKAVAATWEIGDQCEPERFFYEKESGRIRAVRP